MEESTEHKAMSVRYQPKQLGAKNTHREKEELKMKNNKMSSNGFK